MRRCDSTKFGRLAAAILVVAIAFFSPRWVAAQLQQDASRRSAVEFAAQERVFENRDSAPGKTVLTPADEKFLDDLQQRGIRFFVDCQDPETGLMPDRAVATGPTKDVSSVAAIGFGLTAICIADERGWISHDEASERCTRVLRFLRNKAPQERGHFYHFLNMRTGERMWNCEVSNIDTALLMAGVITVRQHFPDTELAKLANELYERVDWPWLMRDNGLMRAGWKPDEGFLKADWGAFSECPTTVVLMGLGSKTHPLPSKAWKAWKREPVITYAGLTFIQCPPLFTHQYPQCWFDLRGMRDDYADYFRNSQLATLAQRDWCMNELSKRYPVYGANFWGITASDGPNGYKSWGGPRPGEEADDDIDGVVVPCAAAGSLPFEPRLCLDALQAMKARYGEKAYLKYGFVDAFNPTDGWYNADVLGIDVGPTVLMAENCRSGFVWKVFMSSPEARAAMKAAGFRPLEPKEMASMTTTSVFDAAASAEKTAESR